MSTTIFDMARSAFSSAAFAQLVRRLRHSNTRYNQIAHQFRCRFRPTHHAKARAYRAGLRIDTSKARACPAKYISLQPPPVLDTSVTPSWSRLDPPISMAHATSQNLLRADVRHATGHGDAYMCPSYQRIVHKKIVRRHRRRDGRARLVLRLPPLKLQVNVDYSCAAPFDGPVPGAPRLMPRQLPDDEGDMEELMLGTVPSVDEPESLLRPAYSGLCITIPPRNSKRKLQDIEEDRYTQNPKVGFP
ncbi:hypothetical protein JVU11DRAFT_9520 [Chiua virens]|nr:hypothetical protein JVU11DRAFT_9520 [Chiua virens]